MEVLTEYYNVAILSSYTDKGYGKKGSRKNAQPAVLLLNNTFTKSKKDSARNIKATQNILILSIFIYPKKCVEGKEINPISNMEEIKSKEKDVVDAKSKNLAIPEDQIMTTATKITILELDRKSECKHITDVTIFANDYQFKKLIELINKYKSLWDDTGSFVDISED